MANPVLERLYAVNSSAEELESTIQYLEKSLKPIVKDGEATLVCFPREKETDFGSLVQKAVERCGSKPVFWEHDLRWKTLLRLAFLSKASTIIGPPLVVLGLSKIAAHENVPLYFYNTVLAGYPCLDWMIDGIEQGMDCKSWGFFGPGIESVVSGFSCGCGRGVHIREDKYGIDIVDDKGNLLSPGQHGTVALYSKLNPEIRYESRFFGSIMSYPCPCGNMAPKLIGIDAGDNTRLMLLKLSEELLYWSSILDCRIDRTESGIDLEIVCLRGEKLPSLPSCAKLVVRPWDPETDIPMSLSARWTAP